MDGWKDGDEMQHAAVQFAGVNAVLLMHAQAPLLPWGMRSGLLWIAGCHASNLLVLEAHL